MAMLYGYGVGVWLGLRQGHRAIAMATTRAQVYGYIVGLWHRGVA